MPPELPAKTAAPPLINRELSLLAFNRRVLALAQDAAVPILERLRFLCIVSSNLDEFFEIRVAGMREQLRVKAPPPGVTLHELRVQSSRLCEQTHLLVADIYRTLNGEVLPAMAEAGIRLLRHAERNGAQRAWVADYFRREVKPLLSPIGLDPAHPFPQVVNKSLNFVVELSGSDAFGRETAIAIVKAPLQLPRVIELPAEVAPANSFVLLASIIHAHLGELFAGRRVVGYSQFRVTRDADLWFDDEEVKNLRQALEGELPQRQFGLAVRLEVAANCAPPLAQLLLQQFELEEADLYRCDGPVNLARLTTLVDESDRTELKYPPFAPGTPDRLRDHPDILAAIRQHDILLHHPYQSFDPVVEFIRKASDDPDVVAIKQTVYRTGVNSILMDALVEAARRRKEVTVVVELLARFDEEANINWAERLEEAGAQVVYGVFGLKTHAKLALLLRREPDAAGRPRLRPYAHLGTGNYHPRTARQYTDFGLLTVNPELCADVAEVFLHITSLARSNRLKRLWLAPFTMHRQLLAAIHRETRHAREGEPARIMAKMNGLVEEAVIRALYAASQAGVKIDLIVRGACALRPGVKGWSDNIRVRSIVGRFLEHPRIWYFANGGSEDVYLSSADWMGRNLFRRIEVAFPVLDKELKARVIAEGLQVCFDDNCSAWDLGADGDYVRAKPARRGRPCATQELLLDRLAERPGAPR
ncbi:MAG TPA: polyphosphate kinase 1 [Casimicrobiaceae bacterium]|jgi:polyphosphate kinase|nr:polyphosphate kinase 1 [Casimicrobiaceae bacterium]